MSQPKDVLSSEETNAEVETQPWFSPSQVSAEERTIGMEKSSLTLDKMNTEVSKSDKQAFNGDAEESSSSSEPVEKKPLIEHEDGEEVTITPSGSGETSKDKEKSTGSDAGNDIPSIDVNHGQSYQIDFDSILSRLNATHVEYTDMWNNHMKEPALSWENPMWLPNTDDEPFQDDLEMLTTTTVTTAELAEAAIATSNDLAESESTSVEKGIGGDGDSNRIEGVEAANIARKESEPGSSSGEVNKTQQKSNEREKAEGIVPSGATKSQNQNGVSTPEAGSSTTSSWLDAFSCTLCSERFARKLQLNNHMNQRHGVKFVFTERGRKVKLVRLPENYEHGEQLDPGVKELMRTAGAEHIEGVIGVQQIMHADQDFQDHGVSSNRQADDEEDEDDFGCGMIVKLDTDAYRKALERNQIPFAAFLPANSKKVYVLKIVNCSEKKQLLEPATTDDILQAYARNVENFVAGNFAVENRQSVAIVCFVVQKYNEAEKRMDLFVEPPTGTISSLKLFKPGTLIDFAFAPPEDSEDEDGRNKASPEVVNIESSTSSTEAVNEEMDVDVPAEIELEEKKDDEPEVPAAPTTSPICFSMPTLVAVQPVDSSPERTSRSKKKSSKSKEETLPPKLIPKIAVKQEVVEEPIKVEQEPLHTPEQPIPKSVPEAPRSRKLVRSVKAEPIDYNEDLADDLEETSELTRPATESPKRTTRRRGRPRKLKLEELSEGEEVSDEGPKSKISKRHNNDKENIDDKAKA